MKFRHNLFGRWIAAILCSTLLFGVLPIQCTAAEQEKSTNTNYGLTNPTLVNRVGTWDCIYFGNYWQDDTNGDGVADEKDDKKPIRWRVLFVDGDDAFLLADKILDWHSYDDFNTEKVTWEKSLMRSWLNGYASTENSVGQDYTDDNFLNNAFNEEERDAILDTTVDNQLPDFSNEDCGNNTTDKVYLLSRVEAVRSVHGFETRHMSSKTRVTTSTSYAAGKGMTSNWWLRSRGQNGKKYVGTVGPSDDGIGGYVYVTGQTAGTLGYGVRPVLHLNLAKQSVWSHTKGINSNGTEFEWVSPTPTETPSLAPSATVSPTPTETPSPTPSATVSPTPTVTASPSATATASPTPSDIARPTATATPSPTATVTVSQPPIETASPIPTDTPKPIPTVTASPASSNTPSPKPTVTASPVPSDTPSPIPTVTASPKPSDTPSPKPSDTASPASSNTPSPIPTKKASPTRKKTVGSLKYIYYNSKGNKTAQVYGVKNKNAKSVTIPNKVKINGKTYKVTGIDKNAFKNMRKLSDVTIGKNIKSIGDGAFRNNTNLTFVLIPEKVTKIGKESFAGCKKLRYIVLKTDNIVSVGEKAFQGVSTEMKVKTTKKKWVKYQKMFTGKGKMPKKALFLIDPVKIYYNGKSY